MFVTDNGSCYHLRSGGDGWAFPMAVMILSLIALVVGCGAGTEAEERKDAYMKIRIMVGTESLEGVLYENPTSRDFASRLPLDIELEDYAGKEKVHSFSRKLSLEGAPAGSQGMAGDITYYSPWGNLAIFYRDHGYASGLVSLGRLEKPAKLAELCKKSCQIRIEAM